MSCLLFFGLKGQFDFTVGKKLPKKYSSIKFEVKPSYKITEEVKLVDNLMNSRFDVFNEQDSLIYSLFYKRNPKDLNYYEYTRKTSFKYDPKSRINETLKEANKYKLSFNITLIKYDSLNRKKQEVLLNTFNGLINKKGVEKIYYNYSENESIQKSFWFYSNSDSILYSTIRKTGIGTPNQIQFGVRFNNSGDSTHYSEFKSNFDTLTKTHDSLVIQVCHTNEKGPTNCSTNYSIFNNGLLIQEKKNSSNNSTEFDVYELITYKYKGGNIYKQNFNKGIQNNAAKASVTFHHNLYTSKNIKKTEDFIKYLIY